MQTSGAQTDPFLGAFGNAFMQLNKTDTTIYYTPTSLIIDPETWAKTIYNQVQSRVLRVSIREFKTEGATKQNRNRHICIVGKTKGEYPSGAMSKPLKKEGGLPA